MTAQRARTVTRSTEVDAPPEAVFALLADPARHALLDGSGSVGRLIAGDAPLAGGSRFTVAMRLFGVDYRMTNRVVEFRQDRLIAWRHFAPHRWRWRLEPLPGGRTRVTEVFDVSPAGPWSWIYALLGCNRRNAAGIEATLRRLAEQAAAGTV